MTFSVVLPGCGCGTREVRSDLQHQDGCNGKIPESYPPCRSGQETQPVPKQRWDIPKYYINRFPHSLQINSLYEGEKNTCTELSILTSPFLCSVPHSSFHTKMHDRSFCGNIFAYLTDTSV